MKDDNVLTPDPDPTKDEGARPLHEWQLYLKQIPGLWAGRTVPVSDIDRDKPADISDATDSELQLLIDLSQRQLDALNAQLEQIRQRAQFLFSTLMLVIGVATAVLPTVVTNGGAGAFLAWAASLLVLILAVLGTTGIVVNRKTMGVVDSGWVTRQSRPWLLASARDHLDSVQPSWETVATQVTLLRDSALLTIAAVIGIVVAWTWAVL